MLILYKITLSPPLQATQPNAANSDSRNYTNSYLVKVLNLRDISRIVIDYMSGENENFTSLLDLTMRLKYHPHAKQMICKADDKQAALLSSARYGYLDFVEYLVEQGADIEAKDEYGNTALILSAYRGHLDCVKYLVEQGADIEAKTNYGSTALYLSAYNGHLACVNYLVEQGADIHAKHEDGSTALMLSVDNGHKKIAAYLHEQKNKIPLF